jgi:hypothetical protein
MPNRGKTVNIVAFNEKGCFNGIAFPTPKFYLLGQMFGWRQKKRASYGFSGPRHFADSIVTFSAFIELSPIGLNRWLEAFGEDIFLIKGGVLEAHVH